MAVWWWWKRAVLVGQQFVMLVQEVQHTWKLKMREQRTALEAAEKALGGAEKSSAPGRYGKVSHAASWGCSGWCASHVQLSCTTL